MGGGSLISCNSSSLVEDLLIDILLRLPVKTLLRFKSVCKPWLSLIESSEFIHSHTNNTITLSPDNNLLGTFIFQSYNQIGHENENLDHEVRWNMFSVTSDHETEVFEELAMQPYYRSPRDPFRILIVGSCNGLICLQDDEVRDVSLWNPAINQFRILPKPLTFAGIGNGEVYKDFVAFGLDVETNDYKVVLVTYFVPQTDQPIYDISKCQYPYRVQVYSLSTDSWRPLEDLVMPTYPLGGGWDGKYRGGGYLNGSYYGLGEEWISGSRRFYRWSVLSFDFTKEIFRTMELPDEITHTMDVTFFDEKIAIIDDISNKYFRIYDVWVLNELGVKESWTKLYTIDPYATINQRPICISNNGDFVFLIDISGDTKLQLLNPSTREFHVVKGLQHTGSILLNPIVYRRSLVPVSVFFQAVSWLAIVLLPPSTISIFIITLSLLLGNLGAAIVEVANDALVAEAGKQPISSIKKPQKASSSGELQSFVWMSASMSGVLGNFLGVRHCH